MSRISQNHSIGETIQELTTFHGPKINISQPIVEAAGLKEPQAQLLTESTSPEIELGLIFPFLLKSSSTAKLEEAATEVIQEVFMPLLSPMVFLKKAAKTM
jgi:hypothetical protein